MLQLLSEFAGTQHNTLIISLLIGLACGLGGCSRYHYDYGIGLSECPGGVECMRELPCLGRSVEPAVTPHTKCQAPGVTDGVTNTKVAAVTGSASPVKEEATLTGITLLGLFDENELPYKPDSWRVFTPGRNLLWRSDADGRMDVLKCKVSVRAEFSDGSTILDPPGLSWVVVNTWLNDPSAPISMTSDGVITVPRKGELLEAGQAFYIAPKFKGRVYTAEDLGPMYNQAETIYPAQVTVISGESVPNLPYIPAYRCQNPVND